MFKEIINREVRTIEKLIQKIWEKLSEKNKPLPKALPLPRIKWERRGKGSKLLPKYC